GFEPRRVLDFGCGVGRLVIPLAKRCGQVVGVDVAQSMLAEARSICGKLGLTNVRLHRSDDRLTGVEGAFDLAHSYIVFQPIPGRRGMALLKRLLALVDDNGVCVLHFVYHNPDLSSGLRGWLRLGWVWLTHPRPAAPPMQMNAYPLNAVLQAVQ